MEKTKPMSNALIIGAAGFIGGHLAERLCSKGYKVIALVRKNSDTRFLKTLDVELRFGDLLQPQSLKNVFAGIDIVFCLANVKPVGKSQKEYENNLYRLHIDGTKNLIRACKFNNVRRLIYLSSVAVVGYKSGVNFYDEFSMARPVDTYGKAKLAAEKILHKASKNSEMDVTILRPPGVFGDRGPGALGKIIFFVEKKLIPIMGSGRNRQSLTYVGNVANEAIYLAEHSASIGKTYITSDDKPYTVNEVVNAVSKAMNVRSLKIHIPIWLVMSGISGLNFFGNLIFKKELIKKDNFIAISTERIFDGSRIFKELGYKQEYDLATAIRRTIEWYKKNKNE